MSRQRHGFTLIELLVVIAIIALLLAIVMPALNRVKEGGKSIACKAHIRQYVMANHIYSAENDQNCVGVFWIGNSEFWDIMDADGDALAAAFVAWDFSEMILNGDLVCPSADKTNIENNEAYPFTYAHNNGGRIWSDTEPIKMQMMKSPSEKILFADSSDFAANGWMPFTDTDVGINYKLHWDVVGDWWGPSDGKPYPHHGVISYRHGEGASLAMVDGHVESRKKEKVWIVKSNGFLNIGLMAIRWDLFDEQVP